MPLPWKKSKPGRISRFVSDLQQSPKHGGSLVVETGFPTSLIDLFVKNRDRLKKNSSKRSNNKSQAQTAPDHSHSYRPRRRVSSPPPPLPLQRRSSLPVKLDSASVTEDFPAGKIEESFVGGLTADNRHDGDDADGGNGVNRGGGGCVLMVVVFKVFVVAVLALSTKKLVVGITLSAFALIFLEFAVARVFTLLNLCPGAQVRLHSLIGKLLGKRRQEKLEEESSSINERRNNISFEIIETFEESRDCSEETRENKLNVEDSPTSDPMSKANPVAEEKESLTIRDVVFKKEKSRSAKLKSKIVKKIVPKKLRSYKKKKKMMKMKKGEEDGEEIEVEIVEEEGEEESVTEVSSLFSEDRVESEISERDELSSNPPLLESCEEIAEGEEEEETGSKGDLTKAVVLIVIALAGLLSGKVVAIGLTLSLCLILRVVCSKSQTQTSL
uniref:Ethylene-responsive nuclear family protein n=1 Tax=Noccaea caerulescens TaxID=107243 RepID=A0A1J3FCT9_NOCCA